MSEIKVEAVLISSAVSLLGLQFITISTIFTWFFLCVCLCLNLLSLKDISHTGLGPIDMTSFNLITSFKGPISKFRHILRCWRLGLQHRICWSGGGTQLSP